MNVEIAPELTNLPQPAQIDSFRRVLRGREVSAAFQPIMDFRARGYLGYEGLIRGPKGAELHSPLKLFAMARNCGLNSEFERLCRETVLRDFAALRLPGFLFINVSISCLNEPHFMNGHTTRLLEELELSPKRIIIELTENQHVSDFSALHHVLASYRNQGYQIAMDDLGEGFSNLRMWSEVRPEYVKIDRHFIDGIDNDELKFRLVRAMQEIASASGTKLVAEGIETLAEFTTVRDLGIDFGQGFLIAHPTAKPAERPTEKEIKLHKRGEVFVFPQGGVGNTSSNIANRIMQHVVPVRPDTQNDTIYARFEREPGLAVLPVVNKEDVPVGLINRYSLIDRFARPYRRELYGKKPCSIFMNAQPVMVDYLTPMQEIGQLIGQSDHQNMLDGFIVTRNGLYQGIGSTQALMSAITDLQISAARYANPLTQLPGNVPINEHIDRLLQNNVTFAAAYCDIDNFKPYNDAYGYRRGDQLIQMLATTLGEICEPRQDFTGHIGGDDFMLLLQSLDWNVRLNRGLRLFGERHRSFVEDQHLLESGYYGRDRRGDPVFHPLPTLSIGCLLIEPHVFRSHHEVSGAVVDAKHQAKKIAGNSLFAERRHIG